MAKKTAKAPLGDDRGAPRRRRVPTRRRRLRQHAGVRRREDEGQEALAEHAAELGDWQEKLHAESKGGGKRSVLLVQGMDTSGKGGLAPRRRPDRPRGNPGDRVQGPTEEERKHDFLWRIRKALPGPGRSGCSTDPITRTSSSSGCTTLVPKSEWLKRYSQINSFEREVIVSGTRIVKVMTHI